MSFRYMVMEISIANIMERKNASFNDLILTRAILKKIGDYYDLPTKAKVEDGFMCRYFNDESKMAIIKIREQHQKVIRDIIPLITMLNNINVRCQFLYNGGTLERCRRFITNYQKNLLSHVSKGILVINDSIGKLLYSGL